ncbi:thiamine diphosphokinase [Paenibacillus spiritus]|uniref:Thiamine diphosphokinase n=1 Tax=Paenibacillus spiritus TaxID=2496557 RepID=A0A5J5GFJ4_9BACL|nr:thiamine diphosphokinase [Paenibacillus spiritus]KAA9006522.1 thiamine diphosphokinase [Paenibacillus spiritus]
MSSQRVVIFGGGELSDDFVEVLKEGDFVIGADRGALFLVEHGISPHTAVGDFDSVSAEDLERIRENSGSLIACDAFDKDLTDSELALELALERQPAEILLVGVTGSRLDHSLASIQMMTRATDRQVACSLLNRNNLVTILNSHAEIQDRGYTYVSLLPLTPAVTGITLRGFLYPLENATLRLGQSLGVSNKLTGASGTVSITSGLLLVIQSRD